LAAATAGLVAALIFLLVYLLVVRRGHAAWALAGAARPFLAAGVLLGLAYSCNLESLARGRVTVVSPFYATEALWAVLFAYVFLGRSERIGARVAWRRRSWWRAPR